MGAKKSGGTAGRQRSKDAAMAAELKAKGVERRTGKCPICNKEVSLGAIYSHIVSCKG